MVNKTVMTGLAAAAAAATALVEAPNAGAHEMRQPPAVCAAPDNVTSARTGESLAVVHNGQKIYKIILREEGQESQKMCPTEILEELVERQEEGGKIRVNGEEITFSDRAEAEKYLQQKMSGMISVRTIKATGHQYGKLRLFVGIGGDGYFKQTEVSLNERGSNKKETLKELENYAESVGVEYAEKGNLDTQIGIALFLDGIDDIDEHIKFERGDQEAKINFATITEDGNGRSIVTFHEGKTLKELIKMAKIHNMAYSPSK